MSLLLSSAALSLLAVAAVWIAGRRDPAQSPLLTLGSLMRPTHRNVARRLKAVEQPNRLLRRLLLTLTYRDVG